MHATKKRKTGATEEDIRRVQEEDIEMAEDGQSDSESSSGEDSGEDAADGESVSENETGDEEESEDSDEELVNNRQANGSKPLEKKRKSSEISPDQLNSMYESKSSLFKLETDELLKEVQINYEKRMAPVVKLLHKLKEVIDGIPEREPVAVADAEKEFSKSSKVQIPFPDPKPPKDAKYKFGYMKPANINVVGSFSSKTMIKESQGLSIDVALAMPASLFQEKDYMNYRYFYKRAFYLACVAAGIQDAKGLPVEVSYEHLHGDLLRPVIVLSAVADKSELDFSASKCTIRLLPGVAKDTFPAKRLRLDRNCVRPGGEEGAAPENLPATAAYNSSLVADTTMFSYLKFLHSAAVSAKAFKEAAVLGRVWLRQRGFGGTISKGGFGHFEWAALQALLLKGGGPKGKPLLLEGYSNYQMFKVMLQFLASRDLVANPLKVGEGEYTPQKTDVPIAFDVQHNLNILFKMSVWSFNLLRHEAALTVQVLNKTAFDQFDNIFVNRIDQPCLRFDTVFTAPLPSAEKLEKMCEGETVCVDKESFFLKKLYRILVRALTDRVKMVHIQAPERPAWSTNKRKQVSERQVVVGLLLEPEKHNRAVDHGPAAENKKEAAAYRKFWGEKSELRRFKDGSILESCVWDIKDTKDPVITQIVRYILKVHVGEEFVGALQFVDNSEYVRRLPVPRPTGSLTTAIFQPALNGFDTLVKDLRELEGIPLHIRHISSASPSLRYASKEVPLPAADSGTLMEPANVVLMFESSGRWPEDLPAIQKTKLAFLLKIAELLEETGVEVDTRVGLENPGHPMQNAGYLDIIYHSGPAFRVRIFHDKEETMLSRRLKNKSLPIHEKNELSASLVLLRRQFVEEPLLTQAVKTASTRYPLLSPTIRLVKVWFRAHLLDSAHVSEEFIELVVSRVFLHSYPYGPPASLMSGFLRTIEFLALWDWRQDPLIVDYSGEFKNSDVDAIQESFEALRKTDPGFNRLAVFAVTNMQRADGGVWTRNLEKVVAGRMTLIARAAMETIKKSGTEIPVSTLFTPALKDYHFVIHLSPSLNPHRPSKPSNEASKYKNLQEAPKKPSSELLGFHPAKLFYADLVRTYSPETALFFLDENRNSVIAGIWNPGMMAGRDGWKVAVGINTFPKQDGDNLRLVGNRKAVLAEIGRMAGGKGLVDRIEVQQ